MIGKLEVQKILFNVLKDLPSGRGADWYKFQLAFENLTGSELKNHLPLIEEIIGNLSEQNIVRLEQVRNQIPIFWKGIHFDQLEAIVNPQQNNPSINIGNFNATHAQVGNQNATMNIGMTSDELVNALNALLAKKPEEAKTIMDRLSGMASAGASAIELLSNLSGLVISSAS